eukprot:comp24283_c0_seq1/m.45356 comp24283_c0_seq1/g.45356  ORF comp24283_c0_seq1/g.45356 comp24283_c0_seq1/m.45356 type:complete len:313 (+) comp24283_c0_seq1:8148-9086(+)
MPSRIKISHSSGCLTKDRPLPLIALMSAAAAAVPLGAPTDDTTPNTLSALLLPGVGGRPSTTMPNIFVFCTKSAVAISGHTRLDPYLSPPRPPPPHMASTALAHPLPIAVRNNPCRCLPTFWPVLVLVYAASRGGRAHTCVSCVHVCRRLWKAFSVMSLSECSWICLRMSGGCMGVYFFATPIHAFIPACQACAISRRVFSGRSGSFTSTSAARMNSDGTDPAMANTRHRRPHSLFSTRCDSSFVPGAVVVWIWRRRRKGGSSNCWFSRRSGFGLWSRRASSRSCLLLAVHHTINCMSSAWSTPLLAAVSRI